ncbi:uncharacterized protein ACNLHF_011477 [Anomaloglossus baeobatrachus]
MNKVWLLNHFQNSGTMQDSQGLSELFTRRRFGVRRHMIKEEPPLERRMWIHLLVKLRKTHGHFNILYGEMRKFPPKFQAYCHLTMNSFDNILGLVYHRLKHQDTCMRLSISPEEQLLVTLRFKKLLDKQ